MNQNTFSHEELKSIIKEIMSSKIKPNDSENVEEFISKQKQRVEPLLKKISNAKLNEFDGNSDASNLIKSLFTDDIIKKLNKEKGISITFSEDSEQYKEIKKAFLEVLTELGAVKI